MIADLLRPLWTWALWNWRRLALTVLAVLVLAAVGARLLRAAVRSQPAGHRAPAAHHAEPADYLHPARAGSGLAAAIVTRPGAAVTESPGPVTITVPATPGAAPITVVRSPSGWLASGARARPGN